MFKNICLFLFLAITLDSVSSQYNLSHIFPIDYCYMECSQKNHTLCESPMRECGITISMSDVQRNEMKWMLIMGHNGLRNRIAERLHVGNMAEMVWHNELALMADNYIFQCNPFETDDCTLYNDQEKHKRDYKYVVQNRYVQQNTHYPNILIENALRAWYLDRDKLTSPEKKTIDSEPVLVLKNENNFTHLASPTTYNFGCGFRRFQAVSGYILVCNYHPYERTKSNETTFMYGDPGSLCPLTHPLPNTRESFANLCVNAERNIASERKLHFIVVAFYINGLFMLKFVLKRVF